MLRIKKNWFSFICFVWNKVCSSILFNDNNDGNWSSFIYYWNKVWISILLTNNDIEDRESIENTIATWKHQFYLIASLLEHDVSWLVGWYQRFSLIGGLNTCLNVIGWTVMSNWWWLVEGKRDLVIVFCIIITFI